MLRNLLRREVKYQRIEITSALRKQAFFNVNWIVFLNNYEVLVIAEKKSVILNVVTNQSLFIDAGTVVGAIKMLGNLRFFNTKPFLVVITSLLLLAKMVTLLSGKKNKKNCVATISRPLHF